MGKRQTALTETDGPHVGPVRETFEDATRAVLRGDASQIHAWCAAASELLSDGSDPRDVAYRGGVLIASVLRHAQEADAETPAASSWSPRQMAAAFAAGLAVARATHLWWLGAAALAAAFADRLTLARAHRLVLLPAAAGAWLLDCAAAARGLARLQAAVGALAAFPEAYWPLPALALLRSVCGWSMDVVHLSCAAFVALLY